MIEFIINNFPAVAVAVPVLLFIIAGIRSAARRRAEAAQEAAREAEEKRKAAAVMEARHKAAQKREAIREARERAAAFRAAEQQRKREEKEAAREAREAAQRERQAEKIEAARILAEYNERSLQAARELLKIAAAQEAAPAPEKAPEAPQAAAVNPAPEAPQAAAKRPESISYNSPFSGQVVSFTGKLQSMKRADAIKAVQAAGGRAYPDFPAGTTLLVVGTNPGEKKQEKFDRWIGQVKKITEAQFLTMLKGD